MQEKKPSSIGNISQNNKLYKILFISLLFIFIVVALVFFLFPSTNTVTPKIKENILSGESYFSDAKYKEARIAYKKALDIAGSEASRFLEIRYRMAIYLARMDQLISQGDSEEVRQLLEIGKKEEWPEEMRNIYSAHCQNFVQQIEKLMEYRENIGKTIASLKEKKAQDAEVILRNTIRFARKNQTSLNPIKKALLLSLQEGNSESLLMAWQFQQDLGIEKKEIQQSLKCDSSLHIPKKLLSDHNLEVTKILCQFLSYPNKIALAKEYFASYGAMGSTEEQRVKLKNALVLYPAFHEAYYHHAQIDMQDGIYREAKENYEKAQKSYLAQLLAFQGWCEWQKKNPVEAFSLWNKSLENWPGTPSCHLYLGIFYLLFQNPSQSLFHIEKAGESGTSLEIEILKSLIYKELDGIPDKMAMLDSKDLAGYLKLCYAFILYSSGKKEEALLLGQEAKDILIQQKTPPLEALAYQALFQEIAETSEEEALKELLNYQDRQAALFYSMLYFKGKDSFKEYYDQLQEPWKELWQKTQQSKESKDGK